MSLVLYRKWRPRLWTEVVGQDHVVRTLSNAVASERVAHAYLFAGPRGTGKTSTARLLAKAVNCLDEDLAKRPCDTCENCLALNEGRFLDLIEIDAASNTSVDDVRDLREKINFAPNLARYKVYIIDEVHMLSTAAFNALLKTLEEPPPHAIFILATTEVHKIPTTVLSRCQRHEFRRIPVADILNRLKRMLEEEDIEAEEEALNLVARQATGSLRDAISLLDQLASTGEKISLETAESVLGTATSQAVLSLVEALLAGQPAEGLDLIHTALDSGSDARQFARQIVDYLRQVLLIRMGNGERVDAPSEVKVQMGAHANQLSVAQIPALIRVFNEAASEARNAWHPGLPLELAYVEALGLMTMTEPAVPGASTPVRQAAPSPAQKPEAAPAEPEATTSDAVSLHRINKKWQDLLVGVRRRNPQTQGLLNSCKPLGVKDGVLVLGFATEIIKSKMEKPEHLEHVTEVLEKILGVDVGVQCVVSSTVQGGRHNNLGGLEADGMVASAIRDLGGEIVDIQ